MPITQALGIPWSPLLEQWLLIAESAEHEAEAEAIKAAQRKAQQQQKRR